MSTHITFGINNPPAASRLRSGLTQLEQGKSLLTAEQATMTSCLDGDGSNIAHFGTVVTVYGFSNTTDAKAAWDELNADLAKINSDTAQTNTDTALKQLFTKLR